MMLLSMIAALPLAGGLESSLGRRGIQLENCRVEDFAGIRGVGATGAIASGDVVVRTPRGATLSVSSVSAPPDQHFKAVDTMRWYFEFGIRTKLGFKLAESWLSGEMEFPSPERLESLPVHWSAEEVALLDSPAMTSRISNRHARRDAILQGHTDKEREYLDNALDAVQSRAFAGRFGPRGPLRLAALGLPLVTAAPLFLFDSIDAGELPVALAVIGVLASTALLMGLKEVAIVPGACLINHDSKRASCRLRYKALEDAIVVTHDLPETVPAGEQLFVTYGQLDNDSLLLDFGFVEADNPHDTATLLDGGLEIAKIGRQGRIISQSPSTSDEIVREMAASELSRHRDAAASALLLREGAGPLAAAYHAEKARLLEELLDTLV